MQASEFYREVRQNAGNIPPLNVKHASCAKMAAAWYDAMVTVEEKKVLNATGAAADLGQQKKICLNLTVLIAARLIEALTAAEPDFKPGKLGKVKDVGFLVSGIEDRMKVVRKAGHDVVVDNGAFQTWRTNYETQQGAVASASSPTPGTRVVLGRKRPRGFGSLA